MVEDTMRRHTPVMLTEVLEALPQQCHVVMDGTFGHGGHTAGIIQHIQARGVTPTVIGVDKDTAMLAKGKQFLQEEGVLEYVQLVQGSYADFHSIRTQTQLDTVDAILIDIGVNMDHFKEADRGFSIKLDGPLDMRYDCNQGVPASIVLERMSYEDMVIMYEKRTDFSSKYRDWIAKEFIIARKKQSFHTTTDIQTWAHDLGINDKKLAVIFQAIRIEVNDELGALEKFLQLFPDFLIPGGRCIVITYHSIEDRLVKYAFKNLDASGKGTTITKKVIKPHRQEVQKNKAARSAKLRIFER